MQWDGPPRVVSSSSALCVNVIRDQIIKSCKPQVRRTMVPRPVDILKKDTTLLATYSVNGNGKRYDFFSVFTGRDPHRWPFVALASCGGNIKDTRLLKHYWYRNNRSCSEFQILKKIQDAPGVLQIDDDLCIHGVGCDSWSGFTRVLLEAICCVLATP